MDAEGSWKSTKGKAHVIEAKHEGGWHVENHPIQFDAKKRARVATGRALNSWERLVQKFEFLILFFGKNNHI